VAKPEWGTKRICPHCGARFYDMNRDPITCPACSTTIDPVVQSRPRRARAAPKLPVAAAVVDAVRPAVVEPDDEIDVETEEDEEGAFAADDDEEEDGDDEGESAIEDVSELGDDDMADVIETDLDEDEAER
jgi:uncharacterized protein (TIGR02300 family)